MKSSVYTRVQCWQHLGDNLGDVETDAPFVGNQSTVMTFDIDERPDSTERTLLFIELQRFGDTTPKVVLNGRVISSAIPHVGVPGVWEVWMLQGGRLDTGSNRIQIFRPPGEDDFVVGDILIFWHVLNRSESSGWMTIPAARWQSIPGAGGKDFKGPDDIDRLAVNGAWNLYDDIHAEHSVIAIYIDDGHGARQLPYRRTVAGGGQSGTVEFRYIFSTNPDAAQWCDPIAALVDGTWDRDNYIKNTYLPALKWRIAMIPAR